jgi:DNA-binding response OmpR family regulator
MNSCDIAGLTLPRVLIIANERGQVDQLNAELAQRGFNCLLVPNTDGAIQQIARQTPGVMLLDMDVTTTRSEAWELAQSVRQELNIPLIALMAKEELNRFDSNDGIDDFVTKPWETAEVAVRIRRVLNQKGGMESEDLIRCGDLVIDSARCEVSLGGKPIVLTFKEYQLLKFLATNREKVFTREALLNKVWGWDYYGGDRTVDVHIRRLRSKIEDSTHAFIETVRNIGYKFKDL